jgi:hypothetical protein
MRSITHWIRLLPPRVSRNLLRPSLKLLLPARIMEVMLKTPEIQSYASILDKARQPLLHFVLVPMPVSARNPSHFSLIFR